ncbi:hypothetical protein [Massilia sp. S19_KUP03_FR1]|uniref:hypothetical protein n=1 Tax=Massilia sp. S19_KUP03_FR1 TaxID=3025503 RepID=UPI002FCDB3FE
MTIKDELLLSLMGHATASRSPALADQISLCWLKIVRKFSPLIGANSVRLIFERSLENNLAIFDWLPALVLPSQPDTAVERLRTSMTGRPSSDILAAHRAILITFIDLMTTLIGARLTIQFLQAAFPVDGAGSNTEENPG